MPANRRERRSQLCETAGRACNCGSCEVSNRLNPAFSRGVSKSPRAARQARSGKGAWATTLMVWVLIVFMIVPEGFDYAQDISSTMPTHGPLLSRATWLALLGFGALTVFKRRATAAIFLEAGKPSP